MAQVEKIGLHLEFSNLFCRYYLRTNQDQDFVVRPDLVKEGRGSTSRAMLALVIRHEEVIINASSRISYKVLKTKTLKMNKEPKFDISVNVFFVLKQ